jgi:truncated hemoglobin YjbI
MAGKTQHGEMHGDNVSFDLAFPPIPSPSSGRLAAAGEAALRLLVERHHERLRDSSVGRLFPADPRSFDAVVDRIADFVVDAANGASAAVAANDYTWLRAVHLPITIDETARNVWLAELLATFDDIQFPAEARAELWNWAEALSIMLLNRRTMITQPRRYPFADARAALRPFLA